MATATSGDLGDPVEAFEAGAMFMKGSMNIIRSFQTDRAHSTDSTKLSNKIFLIFERSKTLIKLETNIKATLKHIYRTERWRAVRPP